MKATIKHFSIFINIILVGLVVLSIFLFIPTMIAQETPALNVLHAEIDSTGIDDSVETSNEVKSGYRLFGVGFGVLSFDSGLMYSNYFEFERSHYELGNAWMTCIELRWLFAIETESSTGNRDRGFSSLEALYGLSYTDGYYLLSAAVGLSRFSGTRLKKYVFDDATSEHEPVNFTTIGIPIRLYARIFPRPDMGFGIGAHAILSAEAISSGVFIELSYGRIPKE